MPELRRVPLLEIDEPEIAARASMDEGRMLELQNSLRDIGLIQPIVLKPRDGRFEIEAGHRRYLAARSIGWADIPAIIYQPGELVEDAAKLAENVFREDLSDYDLAIFFADLTERRGMDTDAIARAVRHSRDYVEDRLRLLTGDTAVLTALKERKITFSVARELNKCKSADLRTVYLDAALRGGTNARTVAGWVSNANSTPAQTPASEAGAVPPDSTPAPAAFVPTCFFCGGTHDPYNMETVYIHRWERADIERVIAARKDGAA